MLHEPAATHHSVDEAAAFKRRLGLIMLAIYGVIYLVFIIIAVVHPEDHGRPSSSGA